MRNTKIVLFELMLCLLVIYGIFILNKKANEKNEMQNTQNEIITEVQEITEKDEHEMFSNYYCNVLKDINYPNASLDIANKLADY